MIGGYDPNVKNEVDYLSNAYQEYTSGFATSLVRSTCEMLFEQHCEGRQDIEWVYKNGDTGQQYFSIVYLDGIHKQWLFYWLVKKNYFKTILVGGTMRVMIDSFEKWYANQLRYKKVDGTPPGEELLKTTYRATPLYFRWRNK